MGAGVKAQVEVPHISGISVSDLARVFEAEFAVARPDRNLGVKRTDDVVKFTHDWKGVISSTSQVGADNAGRNRGVEGFGFPEARDGYA